MYGARNSLFACSCFTRDGDRRITRCDFGDARENTFQSGRCSHDFFKHRGFVDFFTQSDVFAPKAVFRPLAVFDVRQGDIPTRNLSLFVAQWVKTNQEPAISSIALAQPQLQLVGRSCRESTIKIIPVPRSVIRMNKRPGRKKIPGCLPPLFKTKADVIEPNAVGIKTFATRSEYSNLLRRKVQHLLEFHFTSAQFLLCSFTLSDVDHSAHKFNEIAGRAQNRMTYDVNVPDGAIRMHDAVVRLKRCLLADYRLD